MVLETIKKTIAENITGGDKFVSGEEKFTLDQTPDQSNKVAIITGGSQGIGYGALYTLLEHNVAKVIVLSKTEEVITKSKQAIAEELGQDKADRVHWEQVDLSDWSAVSKVGLKLAKENDRIDILINNAARGIMTQDFIYGDVDRHVGMNHMSHVVLTSHLLPTLKKTAEAGHTVRISNQASNAHEMADKDQKFTSLQGISKDIGPNGLYGRSKLCGILYAKYLTRHLHSKYPNILINATHPGVVETHMSTEDILEPYPIAGYLMRDVMKPFKKSNFEGAQSTVFAATKTEKSGQYICPPAVIEKGSDLANDQQLEENLMKLTRETVQAKLNPSAQGCPLQDY